MEKHIFLIATVCSVLLHFSGAQTPTDPAPPAPQPAAPAAATAPDLLDDKHLFRAGDRVLFRVVEDRDPSVPLQVMDSGDIFFPYVGRVKAAGKTSRALAAELKTLLEKDFYYQASVILTLNEEAAGARGTVFISGEVVRPGTVQIPKERRLMASEAIIAAGGFQQFADQRKVRVIRKKTGAPEGKATEELVVDVKAVLDEGVVAKDLELQPEDRVVVRAKLVNF